MIGNISLINFNIRSRILKIQIYLYILSLLKVSGIWFHGIGNPAINLLNGDLKHPFVPNSTPKLVAHRLPQTFNTVQIGDPIAERLISGKSYEDPTLTHETPAIFDVSPLVSQDEFGK